VISAASVFFGKLNQLSSLSLLSWGSLTSAEVGFISRLFKH